MQRFHFLLFLLPPALRPRPDTLYRGNYEITAPSFSCPVAPGEIPCSISPGHTLISPRFILEHSETTDSLIMAQSGILSLLLTQFVSSVLLVDVAQIKVFPEHGSVSGVFHAWLSGGYAFNASVAREVCEGLGVSMAGREQVVKALALGFETCKFGWIDEQVAVIPRLRPKDSCGQGGVGIITWRAALRSNFDVFCFNSTDYEVRLNATRESPSTAATSTAHTSGARLLERLTKTTPSASLEDVRSTSASFPESVDESPVNDSPANDSPESQAFSDTSPTAAVGLIALLTTVFAFLLLAVAAVCYLKKHNVSRWNTSRQKERDRSAETENCGQEFQAEVKNRHDVTSNTNNVSVTVRLEKENGAATE